MMRLLYALLFLFVVMGVVACAMKPKVDGNASSVTFRFKSSYDQNVLTFWRKIEADGTKGDRFSVGVPQFSLLMNFSYPAYSPETVQLAPGTYYLDSYQVPISLADYRAARDAEDDKARDKDGPVFLSFNGDEYCVSEKGHYTTRNGWDDAKGQPFLLSFIVDHGDVLLPEVTFQGCNPTFADPEGIFTLGNKFIEVTE
jgi:hypothetical protein